MRSSIVLSVLSGLVAVNAQDASIAAAEVKGNPRDSYTAALKGPGQVAGSVTATAGAGGIGVKYTLSLTGLSKEEQLPYLYHVHAVSIPSNGTCADAKAHLTQGAAALNWNCNLKTDAADNTGKLELCEVGQLSGKYGNITSEKITPSGTFKTSFTDKFSSLKSGEQFFIGDKSVVIHNGKNDRLACANFAKSARMGTCKKSDKKRRSPLL